MQINFATRAVTCKLVYYGPGRSGKTTNLEIVHAKAPKDSTGELISIATETDRTLYFDYLPLDLGQIAGMTTKFMLYTVPGQVFYNATRKLVLQGTDGIIFVADSHPDMIQENIESIQNLEENLRENDLNIDELSLVIQYNKRDLENALPIEELDAALNRWGAPTHEAVAVKGEGVFPSLKSISSLVIMKLNRDQGYDDDGKTRVARPTPRPVALPPAAAAPLPAAPPPPPLAPLPVAAAPPVAPPPAATAPPVAPPPDAPLPPDAEPPVAPPPAAPLPPDPAAPGSQPAAPLPPDPAAPGSQPAPDTRSGGNPLAQEIRRRKQREAQARQTRHIGQPDIPPAKTNMTLIIVAALISAVFLLLVLWALGVIKI